MTDHKAIATRLRIAREARQMTPAAWCALTSIPQQSWSAYENGTRMISIDHAIKVIEATGCTLDWIYRGIGPSPDGGWRVSERARRQA
jgi:transcriptional regulator with XRE-family HTH domain